MGNAMASKAAPLVILCEIVITLTATFSLDHRGPGFVLQSEPTITHAATSSLDDFAGLRGAYERRSSASL
jgi:hypothetical protein